MDPQQEKLQLQTRRHFFRQTAAGIGGMALGSMLARDSNAVVAVENPLAPRSPHFAPKAKRVIYLHLTGSPPNLDMFDYKPELIKRSDQSCPDQFLAGKQFAFTSGVPKLLGSPRKWQRVGKAGMWMSDAIPNFHGIADEMCVVHSMHTDQFNHAPAELLIYTGSERSHRWGPG